MKPTPLPLQRIGAFMTAEAAERASRRYTADSGYRRMADNSYLGRVNDTTDEQGAKHSWGVGTGGRIYEIRFSSRYGAWEVVS